jgi:hypothetical protein
MEQLLNSNGHLYPSLGKTLQSCAMPLQLATMLPRLINSFIINGPYTNMQALHIPVNFCKKLSNSSPSLMSEWIM